MGCRCRSCGFLVIHFRGSIYVNFAIGADRDHCFIIPGDGPPVCRKVKSHGTMVSVSPMETQEILRTSIEVDGYVGKLDLRANEKIVHNLVLGMDFGVESDV